MRKTESAINGSGPRFYLDGEEGFLFFEKFVDALGVETVLVGAEKGDCSCAYFDPIILVNLRDAIKYNVRSFKRESLDGSMLYYSNTDGTPVLHVEDWDDRSAVAVRVSTKELTKLFSEYSV